MSLRASVYINSLEFFCTGALPPPHLFIYIVVNLCQHGLIDIYFIVYFIIQCYFYFVAQIVALTVRSSFELIPKSFLPTPSFFFSMCLIFNVSRCSRFILFLFCGGHSHNQTFLQWVLIPFTEELYQKPGSVHYVGLLLWGYYFFKGLLSQYNKEIYAYILSYIYMHMSINISICNIFIIYIWVHIVVINP